MKKIISLLIVWSMIFSSWYIASAEVKNSTILKQKIVSKHLMKKNERTQQYLEWIEVLVNQMTLEQLWELHLALIEMKKNERYFNKNKNVFDYIEAKLYLKFKK